MVNHMGFDSMEKAKEFRNAYFMKYHSTMKGFIRASEENALPPKPDGSSRRFDPAHMIRYYQTCCDADQGLKYLKPCIEKNLIESLRSLRMLGLRLVIFTNGPRAYGLKVLETLGLRPFFYDHHIFGIDDITPHCKPEPSAFLEVLKRIGVKPGECVMFEDSVKNIRACKKLGMGTVLITGRNPTGPAAKAAFASKGGDAPDASDPAVDCVLRTCGEMKEKLPCLWSKRFPRKKRDRGESGP